MIEHGYIGAVESLRERTQNPELTTQSGGLWVRLPAPTQPCVLIQAHPGSGTFSFVNWLQWQHMLVAHENISDGASMDLVELVVSFRYLKHTDAFRQVQLMVRHPLHTIWSCAGLFNRRSDLINVLQNDIPGWAWPGHPLKAAALSWLRFDEAARPLAERWFRREDVDTSAAPPDGRGWNKTTAPGLNTHRYPGERSWERLTTFAGHDLVRRIRERAAYYGYEA